MTPTAEVPATRRPRRARLWRYLRRALLGVVLLAIVLRIALPFVLPAVLDAIAGGFGLTARYEALELSILDGRVTLRQLRIAAKPADDAAAGTLPEPYVELEYAHVDVDMSTLLAGTLRLHRIEVDGLDVRAERAADGRIALLEHFASDPATPETSSEPDSGESTAVDLAPPVWIDALRAQHVRVRIVDHAAAPPLDTWLETNVRVSDLGAPDRDARLAITAHGPALLDHLSVEGSASWNEHGLRGELELELQGAHPGPAAHWLASLGLTPVAGVLDAHARLRATVDRDADDERAVDAELTLDAIRFLADGAEALGVDSVHAVVQDLGPDSATVPVVEVRGVRGHAAKLPDGALQLAGFELGPYRPLPPSRRRRATPTRSPRPPRPRRAPSRSTSCRSTT